MPQSHPYAHPLTPTPTHPHPTTPNHPLAPIPTHPYPTTSNHPLAPTPTHSHHLTPMCCRCACASRLRGPRREQGAAAALRRGRRRPSTRQRPQPRSAATLQAPILSVPCLSPVLSLYLAVEVVEIVIRLRPRTRSAATSSVRAV